MQTNSDISIIDPSCDDGISGNESIGNELVFFQEKCEVIKLVNDICQDKILDDDFISIYESIVKIMLQYLEQSQLLHPHIVDLVQPLNEKLAILLSFFTSSETEDPPQQKSDHNKQLYYVSKVLYLYCRVVGFKYIMKHLLHEVNHLEGCLAILKQQDRYDHEYWEKSYVLLLWLSALCLIPFDICSMDSTLDNNNAPSAEIIANTKNSLVSDIINICKIHLSETGPSREAASICMSSLLTRPDMENFHLNSFMIWSMEVLESWMSLSPQERSCLSFKYFEILGIMHCLFQIFKLGHRFKLLCFGQKLLQICLKVSDTLNQTTTRKLLTKLIQRIGMNFLTPRIASWRYMRGNRSLVFSSTNQNNHRNDSNAEENEINNENDIEDDLSAMSEELESVFDKLINSLHDTDTVVRWSAAKGIGRITMRLSKELAADIIDAVIDCFSDCNADSNWHGGCLALAELSRRGLLLPNRLSSVIPFVEKAIQFDILKGQHSIGSHVRDAACYVCWAFCRAYSPIVMEPYIESLTTSLLTTALFDREVNCRRAASAAYQETVGRQGDQNIKNGIEILTIADYFSVGNRVNCYTSIACAVAKLNKALQNAFILHLKLSKINHWDKQIRILASKSISLLALIEFDSSIVLLRNLIGSCTSLNVNLRHGSILSTAEVFFQLSANGCIIPTDLQSNIIEIVSSISKERLYRGRGGEQIREAVCLLIENIAKSKVIIPTKLQVLYVESLNENLRQPHPNIQLAARSALREFLYAYFSHGPYGDPSERLQKLTVLKYLEGLETDPNASVTRGYALALGVLPLRLAAYPDGQLIKILKCLANASSPTKKIGGEYDANTCSNSLEAFIELVERIFESTAFTLVHMQLVFEILCNASEDYSIDKRGDTGSWCRVLSLKGIERLIYAFSRKLIQIQENYAINKFQIGQLVDTSYGNAIITRVSFTTIDLVTLEVVYPKKSLGDLLSNSTTTKLIVKPDIKCGNNFQHSENTIIYSASDIQFPPTFILKAFSIILKQLSEKLDSVREVAGNVLTRLIDAAVNDRISITVPDQRLILDALYQCSDNVATATPSPNVFNWSQPNHVFPFVCHLLQSELYFYPILSGLVISVGGLTESISKISAQSLLKYCDWINENDSSKINHIGEALIKLLTDNQKKDRVIVPALKTIEILIRNGVFKNSTTAFSVSLYRVLLLESKSTNVIKLCAIIDLYIHILTLCLDNLRYKLMDSLLAMTTHRYPRVRKYSAEQLYLFLLTDIHVLGFKKSQVVLLNEKADGDDVCYYFNNQDDVDTTLNLLASTTWDIDDKYTMLKVRLELTHLFSLDSSTVLNLIDAYDKGEMSGTKTSKQINEDELDSYEALVRDVGY